MFSTPETSVHVLDKNREISPLETEEGYVFYVMFAFFVDLEKAFDGVPRE